MKNNIDIERIALNLLDACGGELNPKDIKRFWENYDGYVTEAGRKKIEIYAEQLISMP